MKALEVRQNAIDASLEEIEKVEAEIVKASNGGNGNIRINVPYDKHRAILAYFRDIGEYILDRTLDFRDTQLEIKPYYSVLGIEGQNISISNCTITQGY